MKNRLYRETHYDRVLNELLRFGADGATQLQVAMRAGLKQQSCSPATGPFARLEADGQIEKVGLNHRGVMVYKAADELIEAFTDNLAQPGFERRNDARYRAIAKNLKARKKAGVVGVAFQGHLFLNPSSVLSDR